MSGGRLSSLQLGILAALADLQPPFVLGGGGALVGFHLQHRTTRDLDLFWRRRLTLDRLVEESRVRLVARGYGVEDLEKGRSFCRFRVSAGNEVTVVDLVADPTAALEPPIRAILGAADLQLDSRREILVNKLCALLGRTELRDLQDVRALVEAGEDLDQAVADAPRRDAGFSPLTLAWLLEGTDLEALGRASGTSSEEVAVLLTFRRELVIRLLAGAAPPAG